MEHAPAVKSSRIYIYECVYSLETSQECETEISLNEKILGHAESSKCKRYLDLCIYQRWLMF